MAFADVGDETRILLAEADQGLVLLLDPAHRETALAPVAPVVAHQRRQHRTRADVADAGQIIHQHLLLGDDLLAFFQMLQHAAGTDAEVRAARLHSLRRGREYLHGLRLVEVAALAGLLGHHRLTRQCAGDEGDLAALAFTAGDAAAIMAEVEDVGLERSLVYAGTGSGHVA